MTKTMLEMIVAFPDQLEEAILIGEACVIRNHNYPIHKVFVSGMGGSGIGGNFVASFIQNQCPVPYTVGKSYDMPAYVDKNTLVVVSSYSGNTEETLSCFKQIILTKAKIVCISSGGELLKLAVSNNLDFIKLPDTWSSPRACLGFSLVSQLYILSKMKLTDFSFIKNLNTAISLLKAESNDITEKARQISELLSNKMVVIYATDRIEPVAIRFRQQLNENSKMLCWHHVIPEMNHNELVGWRWQQNALAVLFIRNADDHLRNQARIELSKEIISNYSATIVELYSKGETLLERSFYLIHLLDYVSLFLSENNKVDAIEVRVIDFLKNELSKI